MGAKLTTSEWVAKARAIWADEYDYSAVEYHGGRIPVLVRCKQKGHGAWSCHPSNHIKKIEPRGCPKCGRKKQQQTATKTFAVFVRDSVRVHGHKYTYDDGTYHGSKHKTAITCGKHGVFYQTPDAHISQGHGCPTCGDAVKRVARLIPEKDIDAKVKSLSNGKVRLLCSTYRGMNRKATFRCKEHGEFKRLASSAVVGANPCTKCSGGEKYARGNTSEEMVERLRQKFADLYELAPFKYAGQSTEIKLNCVSHGPFQIQARGINKSPGCPKCAYKASDKKRKAAHRRKIGETLNHRIAKWLSDAKTVHGKRYDYSHVVYKDARTSVEIICPVHGSFTQTPGKHLTAGCRRCAFDDFKGRYTDKYFRDFPERKKLPAKLYYVKFTYAFGVFYKVGVTSTTLNQRFVLVKKAGIEMSVMNILNTNLFRAFRLEQELQEKYGAKSRYRPEIAEELIRKIRIGPSECFANPLPRNLVTKIFGS